jgi:hypothetical protein
MYNDDDIRIPDEFQMELDEVMYLSLQDIYAVNKINSDYEQSIIQEYNSEYKKRHDLLEPILFEINKVSKFDKDIKELNQLITPIINSYYNRCIDIYEFDELMYKFIFKHIGSLRISKSNIEFLKTIFVIKK